MYTGGCGPSCYENCFTILKSCFIITPTIDTLKGGDFGVDGYNQEQLKAIEQLAFDYGAAHIAWIETEALKFDTHFRTICESKTCGAYGTNWMCPPFIAPIDDLIQCAKSFQYGFVFQTVTELEDSFDIEGMLKAGKLINQLARRLKNAKLVSGLGEVLVLGGGACGYCPKCTVHKSMPCPFPDQSIASVEAYGIDAMSLAQAGALKYMNGYNTVTFNGVILFKKNKMEEI